MKLYRYYDIIIMICATLYNICIILRVILLIEAPIVGSEAHNIISKDLERFFNSGCMPVIGINRLGLEPSLCEFESRHPDKYI